jgi:hypothetical protein
MQHSVLWEEDMARPKKPRKVRQGIDQVVGYLRDLISDPATAARLKLEAIDRLAVIDSIYDVPLGRASQERPVKPPPEPEPEVKPDVPEADNEGDQLLKTFRSTFLTGGSHGKSGT